MNENELKQYVAYLEGMAQSLEDKANEEARLTLATVYIAKANGLRMALNALETKSYGSGKMKDKIIDVRRKKEHWFDQAGVEQSSAEIAIYSTGTVTQFPASDVRLPLDIEQNFVEYWICKEQSGDRITRVWFEKRIMN